MGSLPGAGVPGSGGERKNGKVICLPQQRRLQTVLWHPEVYRETPLVSLWSPRLYLLGFLEPETP